MHVAGLKFDEKIISEKINAKFLLLYVFSFDIFHTVKIGR